MNATADGQPGIVGIDIGGANLKYFGTPDRAAARIFPLWQQPERLAATLVTDLSQFQPIAALAVTMTGELADCFADRQAGVVHIVDQVASAAGQLEIEDFRFYGVDGRFHAAADAKRCASLIASANWHALASQVAAEIAGTGILVDVGSTTTDLIPIAAGSVATQAKTDHDRLVEGSLVYVGCRRTPICALVAALEYRGQSVAVMNEWFATIDDALLILGMVEPDPHDCDTADHQPRTTGHAKARLARMIGLDRDDVGDDQAADLADQVVTAAASRIRHALDRLDRNLAQPGSAERNSLGPGGPLILAGHGDGLLDIGDDRPSIRLADRWGAAATRCAPSVAVAKLFRSGVLQRCGALSS